MHRIDEDGHVGNLFTEGVPNVTPATKVGDDWLNDVQEELCNLVEAHGDTLVKGNRSQVLDALFRRVVTPGGRLSLDSSDPLAEGSGIVTSVRYVPYVHNVVPVYDGTRWVPRVFASLSQANSDTTKSPAAAVANTNYDVFVWSDGGTMRATRGPSWTSDTARGTGAGTTELERFEGRWVNKNAITNGPAARRGLYVGTVRTNATTTYDDSISVARNIWNAYNRVPRAMQAFDGTNSWSYSAASWRQANASSANQLNFIIGLDEGAVSARAISRGTAAASRLARTGIGLDSTTALAADALAGAALVDSAMGTSFCAFYAGRPGIGKRFLSWLEYGDAGGAITFYGDNGTSNVERHGIVGEVWA